MCNVGEDGLTFGGAISPSHARLQQNVLVINEILRHFWACIPCSTPAQEQKAKRLMVELHVRQGAVTNLLQALDMQKASMTVAAQHIMQAVQAASSRFEVEQARSARTHHRRLLNA